MPFPSSDRVVFENNPLVDVICQLRFPRILEISSSSPVKFQNLIRKKFPIFLEEPPNVEIQIPDIPSELLNTLQARFNFPKGTSEPVYKFQNEIKNSTISLKSDFIAYSESEYRDWKAFRKNFKEAEKALRDTYEPAFYSRIGLRYRNEIRKGNLGLERKAWSDLLKPEAIGLLGSTELGLPIQENKSLTLIDLEEAENSQVNIRKGIMKDDKSSEHYYLIDIDIFTAERSKSNEAFKLLEQYHVIAGNIFRWFISPELYAALGPK